MKLTEWMKKKSYSFTDLAEKAGVDRSTIERIAYGQAKMPHPKTKRKIAEALNIEVSDIEEFAVEPTE